MIIKNLVLFIIKFRFYMFKLTIILTKQLEKNVKVLGTNFAWSGTLLLGLTLLQSSCEKVQLMTFVNRWICSFNRLQSSSNQRKFSLKM